jgi:hypothetical protein
MGQWAKEREISQAVADQSETEKPELIRSIWALAKTETVGAFSEINREVLDSKANIGNWRRANYRHVHKGSIADRDGYIDTQDTYQNEVEAIELTVPYVGKIFFFRPLNSELSRQFPHARSKGFEILKEPIERVYYGHRLENEEGKGYCVGCCGLKSFSLVSQPKPIGDTVREAAAEALTRLFGNHYHLYTI